MEDIDRHEAEVFSRIEGTEDVAEQNHDSQLRKPAMPLSRDRILQYGIMAGKIII
mgnify:CR=1 FL=1